MSGMIESVIVARVEGGMIVESEVFAGTNPEEQTRLAEEHFKDLCQTSISNWDEYTAEDIEACVENGVALYAGGKKSIQLHHVDNTLILPTSGTPMRPDYVCKDNIFIVTPGNSDEDKLHKVCRATAAGSLQLDIYPNDKYDEIGARMTLKGAKAFAVKQGCSNPKVI